MIAWNRSSEDIKKQQTDSLLDYVSWALSMLAHDDTLLRRFPSLDPWRSNATLQHFKATRWTLIWCLLQTLCKAGVKKVSLDVASLSDREARLESVDCELASETVAVWLIRHNKWGATHSSASKNWFNCSLSIAYTFTLRPFSDATDQTFMLMAGVIR